MTETIKTSFRLAAATVAAAWLIAPFGALAQGVCPRVIAGDCTGDGLITVADANTAFAHVIGFISLAPTTLLFDACNVSGAQGAAGAGGVIDLDDVAVLVGFLTGQVDALASREDPIHLYLTHNGSSTLGQWDMAPLAPSTAAPLAWPLVNAAGGPFNGTRRVEMLNSALEQRVLVTPLGFYGVYELNRCFPPTTGPMTGCGFVNFPAAGGGPLAAPYVHDITHDDFFSNQFHIVSSLINLRPSHYGYGTTTRPFGPIAPQPVCQFELQPQLFPLAPPADYEAADYQPPARSNPFVGDVWVGATGLLASVDSLNLHDINLPLPFPSMRVQAIAFDGVPPPAAPPFTGSPGAGYMAGTMTLQPNGTPGAFIAHAGKRTPHTDPISVLTLTPPSGTTRVEVYDVVLDQTPRVNSAPDGIGYVAWMSVQGATATGHLTSFALDPSTGGPGFALRRTVSLPDQRIGGLNLIRPAIGEVTLYAYRSEALPPATVVPAIDTLDASAGLPVSLAYTDPAFFTGSVPVNATGPALALEITRSR